MLLCGIIKPHALDHTTEILSMLQKASIEVRATKSLLFTHSLVEILYDHMPSDARHTIAQSLAGKVGLALLVSVPSIECVLEIVGRESDPRLCAASTIRARFGVRAGPTHMGTDPWWENAFHRPIDEREAARDLREIFNPCLLKEV
jgi:nucleoside diphosphate kinase